MEGTNGPSISDRTPEEASFDRAVKIRLAHYGPNPSAEIINRVIAAVEANLLRQSGAAAAQVTATPVEKRKVNFAAFKNFLETEGEIDGYLADFERQCALHKVPAEDWVMILSGKLSGRASEAFRAIPDEEVGDYNTVKEALLSRYAVTPEAYRRRFRDTVKLAGDSYLEWACKVHRTAAHWIAGCQAMSGEEVLQLFLLEHCFDKLPAGVREWVRARKPSTLHEAARLADEYTDARKLDTATTKPPARVEYRPPVTPAAASYQPPAHRYTTRPLATNYPQRARFNLRGYSQPIRCFGCKQLGHKRPECPLNAANQAQSWRRPAGGITRNPQPAARYIEAQECWGILHEADLVQAAHRNNRQLVKVNGKEVSGLRDTGATMTLLRKNLVSEKQHTGDIVAVRVAGGTVFRLPVARVHLDWGVGARPVNVGVKKDLPADVLLGNNLAPLVSAYAPMGPADVNPVTTCAQIRAAETDPPAAKPQDAELSKSLSAIDTWKSRYNELMKEKSHVEDEMVTLNNHVTVLAGEKRSAEEKARLERESLLDKLHRQTAENTSLRVEHETLKTNLATLEEKLTLAHSEVQQLKGTLRQYEGLVDTYKEQVQKTRKEADEICLQLERSVSENKNLKDEMNRDMEQVRKKFHYRLSELEQLPEMLRITEMKLQECQEQLHEYENKNSELTSIISDLRVRMEQQGDKMESTRDRYQSATEENKLLVLRLEELERKLEDATTQNRELMQVVAKREDSIHQNQLRLEEKSRECASLARQLEAAIEDSRRQVDQTRERASSKERITQSKILDLETQLSKTKTELNQYRRTKDDAERRFQSRLQDLKDRLEQSESTNRSMQNYVQFLKSSYANVFGEAAVSSSPIRPRTPL